ncbi:MAG: PatB family C-S lyase [Acidobacteria bacterium]|nr:PatB family C-S lyase [Acidobacteriota bacterium]
MRYDFDEIIDRRATDSIKWGLYAEDVIPMWVADMDFRSAEPIIRALRMRVDHGVFGYSRTSEMLSRAIQDRMHRLYGWVISPQEIIYIPGIVTGLNIAFQAYCAPGEAVVAQPPVYFHFLRDPVRHGRILKDPPLVPHGNRYEIDFEELERAITPDTRLFVLCNPHNPVGRVFTEQELTKLAEICLRHDIIICSDEIHCDLVFPPHRHIPVASLAPEIESQTITLMSPSKTYNLAGLECAYAVIKNPEIRKIWKDFSYGMIPGINIAGHVAALAALDQGQDWLNQVLKYLQRNRDELLEYVRAQMPSISVTDVEATYLAWLDCRDTGIEATPSEFFLKNARVALSDGAEFGQGGENYVRMNFACPRKILFQALDRMKSALKPA